MSYIYNIYDYTNIPHSTITNEKRRLVLRNNDGCKIFTKIKGVTYYNDSCKIYAIIALDEIENVEKFKSIYNIIFNFADNDAYYNIIDSFNVKSYKTFRRIKHLEMNPTFVEYIQGKKLKFKDSHIDIINDELIYLKSVDIIRKSPRGGVLFDSNNKFLSSINEETFVICEKEHMIESDKIKKISWNKIEKEKINRIVFYKMNIKKIIKKLNFLIIRPDIIWIVMDDSHNNENSLTKDDMNDILKILFWDNNVFMNGVKTCKLNIINFNHQQGSKDNKKQKIELIRHYYPLTNIEKKIMKFIGDRLTKTEKDEFLDINYNSVIHNTSHFDEIVYDKQDICLVCNDLINENDSCLLSCNHRYCYLCYSGLIYNKQPCCFCRKKIDKKFVRPLGDIMCSKIENILKIIHETKHKKIVIYIGTLMIPYLTNLLLEQYNKNYIMNLRFTENDIENSTNGIILASPQDYNIIAKVSHIDTMIIATLNCKFILNTGAIGYDYLNGKNRIRVYILEYES